MNTLALISLLLATHGQTATTVQAPTEGVATVTSESLDDVTTVTSGGSVTYRVDAAGNVRAYHLDGSITCLDSDGREWTL